MDFDTLLSAWAFAVAVGGLVPIFIIKEDRRKELAIVIVVSLLIALTATMAVRGHAHASKVRDIQNSIVRTLSGNRWTSDQLYKQLHYPHRREFFEALFGAVEEHRIQQSVVQVRIDDSRSMSGSTGWNRLEPKPAKPNRPTLANCLLRKLRTDSSRGDQQWRRLLFSTAAVVAFRRRRKT